MTDIMAAKDVRAAVLGKRRGVLWGKLNPVFGQASLFWMISVSHGEVRTGVIVLAGTDITQEL
jgi:hypothetical protein